MSQRALKLSLWLLLVATIPVPYQLADREWAPTLRLVFLSSITLLLHLSEGFGGKLWAALLGLSLAQSAVYLGLFYAVAACAARALAARVSPRGGAAILAVAALLLVGTAAAYPFYVTPISSQRMYSSLLDVLR